jgi:hypothetical protein
MYTNIKYGQGKFAVPRTFGDTKGICINRMSFIHLNCLDSLRYLWPRIHLYHISLLRKRLFLLMAGNSGSWWRIFVLSCTFKLLNYEISIHIRDGMITSSDLVSKIWNLLFFSFGAFFLMTQASWRYKVLILNSFEINYAMVTTIFLCFFNCCAIGCSMQVLSSYQYFRHYV